MVACQGESLEILNPKDPPKKWRMRGLDVLNWAKEKGLEIPTEIKHFLKPVDLLPRCASYNGYSTPQMEALFAVVDKFWISYDRDNPATAPKQAVVVQWLLENFDLSKTQARAIDQIARAPERRKGGQSKVIDTPQ